MRASWRGFTPAAPDDLTRRARRSERRPAADDLKGAPRPTADSGAGRLFFLVVAGLLLRARLQTFARRPSLAIRLSGRLDAAFGKVRLDQEPAGTGQPALRREQPHERHGEEDRRDGRRREEQRRGDELQDAHKVVEEH
ncbi:hypothetical protein HMPREF0972_00343 [Actinomyces sp. oral taxon 848 str. F0332]|nr:hypothetical protein HMPREF0972_00343 [Actinomyces sp. oral taxon 848 str. F0332]